VAFLIAYWNAMNMTEHGGAPFWLPDSVLLCALLLSPTRVWPVFLVAPLPLRLTLAVLPGTPIWFLLSTFANDSLKAVAAAGLLRWALGGRRIRFDQINDFWLYLAVAGLAAPAVSGLAGAASWVPLGRDFWTTWRRWFLGDSLANIVLTPLLLYVMVDWRKLLKATPARYLEGLVVLSGLVVTLQLAYEHSTHHPGLLSPYVYIPVAFLLLTAVRFGPAGASGALAIMSVLLIRATSAAQPVSSAAEASILSIQLFLIVIGVPILSLSVLLEEQRLTERSLRESEARFRNMADTAPVMIWISGPDRLATFFNRGWLQFTGRGIEQELGYGWTASVHPDQRDECLASYAASFEDRRRWDAECRLRRADGDYRWMLCSGVPRFTVEGTFTGYVVSGSDITDLKNAQDASLARQKLESLGVLAGGIAHDFNNLLGSIYVNAEIAEMEGAGGAFPAAEIRAIQAISMRASEIVRQLMIYAGNEKSNLEPLDLSRLVKELLVLIEISISKSAVLKSDLAKDLPAVLGNGPQIQQVVMNLVLNASEALDGRDGVITVTTSRVTRDQSPDGSPASYIRLEVSDTGAGITKEAQAKIFDPFFTTKLTGRGLGLAVVQGIVRAHKGVIELASVPGQGTTFRVLFPAADQTAEAHPGGIPAILSKENSRTNGTVLLVEDEHVLRLSIAKMLRKEGLRVIEAPDGATAVDVFRDPVKQIDVVLLDMTIPGTPSRAVLAEASRLRPEVKLLLTSAYSREMLGLVSDNGQVRGFIRKPFGLRELVALIRETLAA
jgi:PAS domain S-box-containing protein